MKDIENYEGIYAVTEDGQVWSHKRKKFLKPFTSNNRPLQVALYKEGKKTTFYIHRLVAAAFIPNPENKPQVDHIDGNNMNNHVINLKWATAEENNNNPIHRQRCNTRSKA